MRKLQSKSGKTYIVTKSPGSTFTAAKRKEIEAKCLALLVKQVQPPKPMKFKPLPSLNRLREVLSCSEAGTLRHRVAKGGMPKGAVAGCTTNGYRQVYVDNIAYREHRIVWKMHFGKDPAGMLDHINGNRSDNRISNLREVTALQNSQNRHYCSSNTGIIGVSWSEVSKRYIADASFLNNVVHLGSFIKIDCAIAARKCAEDILYQLPEIREAA